MSDTFRLLLDRCDRAVGCLICTLAGIHLLFMIFDNVGLGVKHVEDHEGGLNLSKGSNGKQGIFIISMEG